MIYIKKSMAKKAKLYPSFFLSSFLRSSFLPLILSLIILNYLFSSNQEWREVPNVLGVDLTQNNKYILFDLFSNS